MATGSKQRLPPPRPDGDINFLALVPDCQKADLLNGVIYLASPDNTPMPMN